MSSSAQLPVLAVNTPEDVFIALQDITHQLPALDSNSFVNLDLTDAGLSSSVCNALLARAPVSMWDKHFSPRCLMTSKPESSVSMHSDLDILCSSRCAVRCLSCMLSPGGTGVHGTFVKMGSAAMCVMHAVTRGYRGAWHLCEDAQRSDVCHACCHACCHPEVQGAWHLCEDAQHSWSEMGSRAGLALCISHSQQCAAAWHTACLPLSMPQHARS